MEVRRIVYFFPLLLLWVANGAENMEEWFNNRFNFKKNLVVFAVVCIILINFLPRLVASFNKKDVFKDFSLELKETGLWIKENLKGDYSIMSRCPELAYYAEKRLVVLPDITYSDLIKYIELKNISYLAIDKRWTVRLYPGFSFLLEEENVPKELRLVYRWDKKPEYKVVVYKIIQMK